MVLTNQRIDDEGGPNMTAMVAVQSQSWWRLNLFAVIFDLDQACLQSYMLHHDWVCTLIKTQPQLTCALFVIKTIQIEKTIKSCPNCRCDISWERCVRNLAAEKAVGELPTQCLYCLEEYFTHLLYSDVLYICWWRHDDIMMTSHTRKSV